MQPSSSKTEALQVRSRAHRGGGQHISSRGRGEVWIVCIVSVSQSWAVNDEKQAADIFCPIMRDPNEILTAIQMLSDALVHPDFNELARQAVYFSRC